MKNVLKMFLVALMGVSLAACGEKKGTVQGVTDEEILIANCAATSGAYAGVGVPFVAGIEAYVKKVNEAGGINNRKITFMHTDDEFDPVKGAACLSNYIETEKVFAIVGHFGTPVVAATIDQLKESGIPSVYFATGIGQLYSEDAAVDDMENIFPVQPIYTTEGKIMVSRGVGTFGAKKIGIIYTNDDAGKDMLKGAQAQAKELNVELVEAQVATGSTDVSSAVTTIKSANVDFIIGASIQQTFPTIVKALAEQNVNKDVITTYVNVAPSISSSIADVIKDKFDVYGNGWVSFDASTAAALAEYQQFIGNADYNYNAYAITGWIAAQFFVEGLNRVADKDLTWESYISAMEEAPIMNPFGGEINYADGKREGTTVMNLSKVKDAAGWEAVEPLESIDEILGNK